MNDLFSSPDEVKVMTTTADRVDCEVVVIPSFTEMRWDN